MKKLIAIILALTLMLSFGVVALADELVTAKITVRFEGIDGVIAYSDAFSISYILDEGMTVYELLQEFEKANENVTLTFKDSGYGPYLAAVNDIEEFANAATDGWQMRVNGTSPAFGISAQTVSDGDDIVLFYSDEYGIGMQFPVIDDTKLLSDGTVRFTSLDTTYDEQWNPTTAENPVVGAEVVWNGEKLTTDDDGVIRPTSRQAAYNTVAISRYDEETGIPTVLRFAPDFYTRFVDVAADASYDEAVRACVENNIINGVGNSEYNPDANMKRADFATLLYRMAAEEDTAGEYENVFTDVAQDAYYAPAVAWASANGIIFGVGDEKFNPDGMITRQDAAVVIERYIAHAEITFAVTRQYVAFSDAEAIADYAVNALQTLYKLRGIETENGEVRPRDAASRAEIAVALFALWTVSGDN